MRSPIAFLAFASSVDASKLSYFPHCDAGLLQSLEKYVKSMLFVPAMREAYEDEVRAQAKSVMLENLASGRLQEIFAAHPDQLQDKAVVWLRIVWYS